MIREVMAFEVLLSGCFRGKGNSRKLMFKMNVRLCGKDEK
jgi:hypothetical protein